VVIERSAEKISKLIEDLQRDIGAYLPRGRISEHQPSSYRVAQRKLMSASKNVPSNCRSRPDQAAPYLVPTETERAEEAARARSKKVSSYFA